MLQPGRSRVRISHYGSGIDLVSNRNKYQEYSWGGGGGKVRPERKVDNLTAICEPTI
jgi:hypothetical protein